MIDFYSIFTIIIVVFIVIIHIVAYFIKDDEDQELELDLEFMKPYIENSRKSIKTKPAVVTAKPKRLVREKPEPVINPFRGDAVLALRKLGMKKKEAESIVDSKLSTKDYDSVENLLMDCF